MRRPHKLLFTTKEKSTRALISDVLGIISAVSAVWMIVAAYRNGGQAEVRYGAVLFLCMIFSLGGLILAILSLREQDKIYGFSYFGIVLNALILIFIFVLVNMALV